MTISRKIMGGYVVMIAILVIITAITFYSLWDMQGEYNRFIDVNERLIDGVNEIRFEVRNQIAHYRAILLYPGEQKNYRDKLEKDHESISATIERMQKLVLTEEGRNMLDEIKNIEMKHEEAQHKVIALSQQGKRAEALATGIKIVKPLSNELIEKAEAFREREIKIGTEGRAKVTATVKRITIAMGFISLLGIISGLLIGFYLTRSITRQLRETIAQLSSSSAEILAMTTQVAAGAAETATSISETTTTVEEVKQTAQLSSQKAKYVSESAQKTMQVSQTGKKSVDESIEVMNHIREQMASVAESIVRLSEQSQAIGEIIATVNDLAEQSNLLAVNAAIEATKAGEQGKGFIVVAQEVKSLAEQSKKATAQVRNILSDIQKATGAAVMATEKGSKAVEAGVKQSTDAGESFRMLADSITESAQAAIQISASSQQQLAGMEQIAMAMDNIKKATEQNVAGTKQAETAAQNLHELGNNLKQLIARELKNEGIGIRKISKLI
jgi:methyl-accepting chemotaxis protein